MLPEDRVTANLLCFFFWVQWKDLRYFIICIMSLFQVVYKLTDFGYAKQYDQSSMCTSFVGTMQYVAPEILQNQSYNKDVRMVSNK